MGAAFVGNTLVVSLTDVKNSQTGTADIGATVTCTVRDSAGNEVTGVNWPVSMPYDANAVDGAGYYGVVDSTLAIKNGRQYIVEINATGSSSEVGKWSYPITADIRESE